MAQRVRGLRPVGTSLFELNMARINFARFRSEHLGFTVECARTYRPRKLSSVFCALVEGLCFAGLEIDFRGLCSDC